MPIRIGKIDGWRAKLAPRFATVFLPPYGTMGIVGGRCVVSVEGTEGRSRELEIHVSAGRATDLVCTAWLGAAWFNPLLLGRALHYRLRLAKASE